MRQKKSVFYVLAFVLLLAAGLIAFYAGFNRPKEIQAGFSEPARDIIGTKVGTSTTGVAFYTDSWASSTKAILIGGNVDSALFSIKTTAASSTPSGRVSWHIYGSNDLGCDTATSSTIYNVITTSQINWYDLAFSSLFNGTSTITNMSYYPIGNYATGTSVMLVNLNWQCLKFDVSGSSTVVSVQMKTKSMGN